MDSNDEVTDAIAPLDGETDKYLREREDEDREDRESDLYEELHVHPFPDASAEKTIRIDRERFSPKWVIAYAHVRNSGIACMYLCSAWSNRRTCPEYHNISDRLKDYKILYRAQKYMSEHGMKWTEKNTKPSPVRRRRRVIA